MQYDINNGVPENLVVLAASPEHLFDRRATIMIMNSRYDANTSLKGCVNSIRFWAENVRL